MTMEDFNVQDMARVKYVREQVWLLKMVKLLILCHIKKNFSFKGASELHVGNFFSRTSSGMDYWNMVWASSNLEQSKIIS